MHEEPSTSELAGLLARAAANDAEVFSRPYDLTSELVYGVALRVIRSPEIAEEVTQEVFIQIWEQASSFDPARGSARGWIVTLAHRRAVDAVRRSQSSRDCEVKVLPDLPAGDVAGKAKEADEEGPAPVGIFRPDSDQNVLVEGVEQGLIFAMTEEPVGGSEQPTGEILLSAEL